MRNSALAIALLTGCAASQQQATVAYVEATKSVVDVTLHAYVALAEQRAAACERFAEAVEYANCIGVLRVPQVTEAARLLVRAQATFIDAYNANDLAGAARAVADLVGLVAQLKELISHVRGTGRP